MNIIEITPQLGSGGAERFVVDLCNELAEHNVVTLIVFHATEDFYINELSANVKLIVLGKRKGVDFVLPFKLYKVIKRLRPDVVHTHLRGIVYSSLHAIFRSRKIKYFHTVHSVADKEAAGLIGSCVRRFLFGKSVVAPVTISEDSRISFVDYYGFNAKTIANGRNVSNSLIVSQTVANEISNFKYSTNDKVLVQLARFNEVKRQDMMARIAQRLDEDGFNFIILMIGRIDKEVLSSVQKINCRRVYVLGEKHNPLEYLKAADAYCLCSTYEGLPISLIEAIGVGSIPICTPVGGIVNLVTNGVNGILSYDISEEQYYQALKRFLTMDTRSLDIMKNNVLESYKPYSMSECAKKYLEVFKSIE